MSTVISVENLGKKYLLSHQTQKQSYVALRDVISEKTRVIGRRLLHPFRSSILDPRSSSEDFWALKDVSFEIKQGDRVGIIGRNGAGKSTLLKILSRIVEPTAGRVRIKGRVASLLEVGTGFHPELTGRENIFLNGAILGMTRAEIKKKFDEIVDFAEIEKFLDTPVKRYSSGMYVRLAFAVAAHLEPEILLVDEVLAVGDAAFQKKCLGKMEYVSTEEGRTVLFVSHNLGAMKSLCTKGVVFEEGAVKVNSSINDCVDYYYNKIETNLIPQKKSKIYINNKSCIEIESVGLFDLNHISVKSILLSDPMQIYIKYKTSDDVSNISVHLGIYNMFNTGVLRFESSSFQYLPGSGEIICRPHNVALVPGQYKINLCLLREKDIICYMPDAFFFKVIPSNFYGVEKLPDFSLCQVLVHHDWSVNEAI